MAQLLLTLPSLLHPGAGSLSGEAQEWAFYSPSSSQFLVNYQSGQINLLQDLKLLRTFTMASDVQASSCAFSVNLPDHGPGLVVPAADARDGYFSLYQFSWELFQ